MRAMPFGGLLMSVAAGLFGAGIRTRGPKGSRYISRYPTLNRSKRHPRATTYREAAISAALGVRSGPLR